MGMALVLGGLLSGVTFNLFAKKFHTNKKENEPFGFLIFTLLGVSFSSLILYILFFYEKSDIETFLVPNILLLSFLEFFCISISAGIYHTLLKKINVSTMAILSSTIGFVSFLLSLVLGLGTFSLMGLTGGIFIFLGVVVISTGKEKIKYSSALWLVMFSGLLLAIATIIDSVVVVEYGITPIFWMVVSYFFPAMFLLLFRPGKVRVYANMLKNRENKILLFFAIVTSFLAYFLWYSAYNYQIAAVQMNFVASFGSVLIVLFSYIFLKERKNFLRTLTAVIISTIGIWLLA
jgi:drug/metabolite transporter (DMT)-like permease